MAKLFTFNIYELNAIDKYAHERFKNIKINKVATSINPQADALMFFMEWLENSEEKLLNVYNSLILVPENIYIKNENIKKNNQILYVDNPRREYAIILQYILDQNKKHRKYKQLSNNVIIGENVKIGKNTYISPFVFIDHDVIIGDNCIIKAGVCISSNVKIGNHTVVKQNSVIGDQGFGIERGKDKIPIRIPHVGGVIIGENVEIGALDCIASGTIDPTIIDDYVMIDDNVMIAHNCQIRKGTMITGSVGIGGSVTVGENCWIGSNAILMDHVKIGKNCIIGICAAVMKSLKSNSIVLGNPADTLDNLYLKRKALKKMQDEMR